MSAIIKAVEEIRELLTSEEGEYDALEKIRELYLVHDYEKQGNRKVATVDCGSVELPDTPKCLYRVLFLTLPKRISFLTINPNIVREEPKHGDMYKQCLLTLVSPDYELVTTVELFKYELALYFSAAPRHVVKTGSNYGVTSGLPGTDNGAKFGTPEAEAWFGLLRDLLERQWTVYGGNSFVV